MIKILIICLVTINILSTHYAISADDPSIQGQPRTESQKAMSHHIIENTYKGKYIIFDAVTGNLLKLDFKDLHIGIVKKGDFYISCADFVDDNENKYDIDFLVAEKNGGFTVFQSIVHSVNGEKRIYHVGDMPDK